MVENPTSAEEPDGAPAKPARTPRARTSAATAGATRRTVSKAPAEPRKATRGSAGRSRAGTTQPLAAIEVPGETPGSGETPGAGEVGRSDADTGSAAVAPAGTDVPAQSPEPTPPATPQAAEPRSADLPTSNWRTPAPAGSDRRGPESDGPTPRRAESAAPDLRTSGSRTAEPGASDPPAADPPAADADSAASDSAASDSAAADSGLAESRAAEPRAAANRKVGTRGSAASTRKTTVIGAEAPVEPDPVAEMPARGEVEHPAALQLIEAYRSLAVPKPARPSEPVPAPATAVGHEEPTGDAVPALFGPVDESATVTLPVEADDTLPGAEPVSPPSSDQELSRRSAPVIDGEATTVGITPIGHPEDQPDAAPSERTHPEPTHSGPTHSGHAPATDAADELAEEPTSGLGEPVAGAAETEAGQPAADQPAVDQPADPETARYETARDEHRSYWPETESVLVRLGLVDRDGQAIEAPRSTDETPADDERTDAFPIGSVPHPITIAEPVPTFDALVARTRARARSRDNAQRMSPPGPLGPGPEAPASSATGPLAQRLSRMLPSREFVQRLLSRRPTGATPGVAGTADPDRTIESQADRAPAHDAGPAQPVPLEATALSPIPVGSGPAPVDLPELAASTARDESAAVVPTRTAWGTPAYAGTAPGAVADADSGVPAGDSASPDTIWNAVTSGVRASEAAEQDLAEPRPGTAQSGSAQPGAAPRTTGPETAGPGAASPAPASAAAPRQAASDPAGAEKRGTAIGRRSGASSRGGTAVRRPRRRPTPAQWRAGARTVLVLAVLLVAAVPAAVLSWRSALADTADAGGVVGGGLAVVGLILLAVGVLKGARAGAGGAQSLPALLARPGALPVVLGLAVLLCAALAVG